MKHLLNCVAIAAALAVAGPAWAQQQYNPAAPGATGTGAPMPAPAPAPGSTSAMPPEHHVVHHAHVMRMHHKRMAERAHMAGDTTAALNRQELARIQSGNMSAPPPPSGPMGEGPPGSPQPAPSH
jgi:hypothetical protein